MTFDGVDDLHYIRIRHLFQRIDNNGLRITSNLSGIYITIRYCIKRICNYMFLIAIYKTQRIPACYILNPITSHLITSTIFVFVSKYFTYYIFPPFT